MSYRVVVGRQAEKSLRKRVAPERAGQIRRAIEELAQEPRPRGAVKMRGTGEREVWRMRVGDYRIVCRVDDEAQEVTILTAGHGEVCTAKGPNTRSWSVGNETTEDV